MRPALTRRLARLEAQIRARLSVAPPPTPEAQRAARAHVRALLAQYEAPLTAVERADRYYVVPLEQRSLVERLARLLGMPMGEVRQWMHTRAHPAA